MCQQWFSIAGLAADITGFLLIVMEWQFGWRVYLNDRQLEISQLYEKRSLRAVGRGYAKTDYEKDEENPSLPKHMEMGFLEEVKYRTTVFYFGVALVVFGFVLQGVGNLPGGIKYFNILSCSLPWF